MVSTMLRSAKERSWFLKSSAVALAVSTAMVLTAPSFSHTTGPWRDRSSAMVLCGELPRLNMWPTTGHPRGPGGKRLRLDAVDWKMVKKINAVNNMIVE